MPDADFRVQLLLTGNEVMSGDTVDSNSATIARRSTSGLRLQMPLDSRSGNMGHTRSGK